MNQNIHKTEWNGREDTGYLMMTLMNRKRTREEHETVATASQLLF